MMKTEKLFLLALVAMTLGNSCKVSINNADGQSENSSHTTEQTNSASEVKIGRHTWMTQNLNIERFRNGDSIPEAKTAQEWAAAGREGKPAWCYYNNDPANGTKYGKLYNWYAVDDARGLSPTGWRIPSDGDWTQLTIFLEGVEVASAGKKMKSTSGWQKNGNGTNSSGFSGMPGGGRYYFGPFGNVRGEGGWWSSTESSTGSAWFRYLNYASDDVIRDSQAKWYGLSVRCLRD